MKTYIECIPCFFNQAISASKMLGVSSNVQKRILDRVAQKIPEISVTDPPPVVAKGIYRIISKETGVADPFKDIKKQSTRLALKLYPSFKKAVRNSRDPFAKALEVAGMGNVIDFGAKYTGHMDTQINQFMRGKMPRTFSKQIPRSVVSGLKRKILKSRNLLYLGDNAGETVFDRIFIEEIKKRAPGVKITYVVRDKAIINDALIEDAEAAGISAFARIVSTGNGYSGLVLKQTTDEFRKLFNKADLVISKGQGNFETLSGCRRQLYFLFLIKCSVVARHIKCKIGEVVLYKKMKNNKI